MPLSTDVNLPRGADPSFPDRCVGCAAPAPGTTWRFVRRTSSWIGLFSLWIGRKHAVEVPCCDRCRPALVRQRWIRDLGFWVATVLALAVIIPTVQGLDQPYRKPVAIGVLLVVLAPTILYQVIRAPAFDLHVRRGDVDYEFGDDQYATEFFELNEDAGATIE